MTVKNIKTGEIKEIRLIEFLDDWLKENSIYEEIIPTEN